MSKGADLDNVFVATNYTKDKNPLNPDNALVRRVRAGCRGVVLVVLVGCGGS